MQYKSVETYEFNIAKEKKYLIRFKEELKESGIPFSEEGGAFMAKITITTNGTFDMSETERLQYEY